MCRCKIDRESLFTHRCDIHSGSLSVYVYMYKWTRSGNSFPHSISLAVYIYIYIYIYMYLDVESIGNLYLSMDVTKKRQFYI